MNPAEFNLAFDLNGTPLLLLVLLFLLSENATGSTVHAHARILVLLTQYVEYQSPVITNGIYYIPTKLVS